MPNEGSTAAAMAASADDFDRKVMDPTTTPSLSGLIRVREIEPYTSNLDLRSRTEQSVGKPITSTEVGEEGFPSSVEGGGGDGRGRRRLGKEYGSWRELL